MYDLLVNLKIVINFFDNKLKIVVHFCYTLSFSSFYIDNSIRSCLIRSSISFVLSSSSFLFASNSTFKSWINKSFSPVSSELSSYFICGTNYPFTCIFNSAIVLLAASNKTNNYFTLFYSFTFGLFFIDFALYPNLKVLKVSLSLYVHIEQFIINVVLLFPPSDSCKIRVSFESR